MKPTSGLIKCLFLFMNGFNYSTILFSQDIHFSQFNYSPLTLNPALTAAYNDIQVTLHYKEQWQIVNAYRTSAATFEMKFNQLTGKSTGHSAGIRHNNNQGLAFGINIFSDKAGDGNMKQTQANLSLAYHAKLNSQNKLSAGIMGGIAQRSISPDGLRWNNQYTSGAFDPALSSGENFSNQSFVYQDYNAGILWSYESGDRYKTSNHEKFINAGISVSHINQPTQTFSENIFEELHEKWTAHANSLIGISNTNFSFGPSLLFQKQGELQEMTFGFLVSHKQNHGSRNLGFSNSPAFSLGCFYRNKDAIIPYVILEIGGYSIGMSYDTNISGFSNVTTGRGGFEITLRYTSFRALKRGPRVCTF